MQTAVVHVGGKTFSALVADTESTRQIGLSETDNMPEDKGMLFVFDSPRDVTMNMVSMSFPLDMLFIDKDDTVIAVRSMNPGRYDTSVEDVLYVLELNEGCGRGMVGEKVHIEAVKTGVIGSARKGGRFDLHRFLRQGGIFKNK
jgi:uncharacterized membrane protein (UPF0127 family)